MILSRTLNPSDYQELEPYAQHVRDLWGLPGRDEHEHRKWEYAIIYKALKENGVETVLDVGGGGSKLAPTLICGGMDVLQVDPADNTWLLHAQGAMIGATLAYDQIHFESWESDELFDAVICVSVLEHVPNDIFMFQKLLKHAKKIVAITVDFSPSGVAVIAGHFRTYNEEMMVEFIEAAKEDGFIPLGGTYDYSHHGGYVYGYNFASLILERDAANVRDAVANDS